jgi:hypothetical protein
VVDCPLSIDGEDGVMFPAISTALTVTVDEAGVVAVSADDALSITWSSKL